MLSLCFTCAVLLYKTIELLKQYLLATKNLYIGDFKRKLSRLGIDAINRCHVLRAS